MYLMPFPVTEPYWKEERSFLSLSVVSWLAGLFLSLISLKVLFCSVTSPFWSSPSTASLPSHSRKPLWPVSGGRRRCLQLSDGLRHLWESLCRPADTWAAGCDAGLDLGYSVNWGKGDFLSPGWIVSVLQFLKLVCLVLPPREVSVWPLWENRYWK